MDHTSPSALWEGAALLARAVSALAVGACVVRHVRAVRSRDARRIRRTEPSFELPVALATLLGFAAGVLLTDRRVSLDRDTAEALLMPLFAGAAARVLMDGRRHGRRAAALLALLVATALAGVG
ncbi:hypothetical protein ACFXD5_36440 [Streptomyces sp. NPDC059385]|uniref:hypothetical protein n=1 Tax=Streptomyces sp. NPDC059385 TaxID=3346817 RepID=UPI0036B0554A